MNHPFCETKFWNPNLSKFPLSQAGPNIANWSSPGKSGTWGSRHWEPGLCSSSLPFRGQGRRWAGWGRARLRCIALLCSREGSLRCPQVPTGPRKHRPPPAQVVLRMRSTLTDQLTFFCSSVGLTRIINSPCLFYSFLSF